MKERLLEAIERRLWTPRSNSARFDLAPSRHTETA
jgi:cobaltochelatase CobN